MVDFIEGDWVYDIETYPNIFTFCAVYGNGKGTRVFEISDRKDEQEPLLDFLRKVKQNRHRLVGFNNIGFDYVVVHHIITKAQEAKRNNTPLVITSEELYDKAMEVINAMRGGGFGISVPANEIIIPQVDLYKIHHFDNKAKATSLKMLEFNMRSDNIEDLPFDVGTVLTDEQKDVLIRYNKHDVMQTLLFYQKSLDAIRFREALSKKYGFDCTNFNDTKIGKEYFINRLESQIPGSCYKMVGRQRKLNQTKRDKIVVGDILFKYLSFKRPELKAIHEWFSKQVITETKGVFSDVLEKDLGDVAKYAEMVVKRKKLKTEPSEEERQQMLQENPCSWIEEVELKSKKGAKSYWYCYRVAETLNVVVDGFRFDFGTGGIHGSVSSQIIESDGEYTIKDADVASMYPNIAIANRVYPLHLSAKFCDIYEAVYKERKLYPKGSPENAALKLALNGVYGDSNNQYSPFYDPQYTMTITINGQLSLCLLAERLIEIEGCTLCQVNTDGVTVRLPRESLDKYERICCQWEKDVGLQLEYADYEKMFIRDVNSYIALYTDGKVKRKGAYEYEDLGWHQNQSALVVQMAVEHELLGRGSAEDFILAHKNHWDFMLRTKVPRSSSLVLVMEDGSEIKQQNICRYYPCATGGKLVKIMPPLEGKDEWRRLGIDTEWNVKPCNDISEFAWDVDYRYYINEARKLIDPLLKQDGPF